MERILRYKLKDGCFQDVNQTTSRIMSSIRGKRNRTTEVVLQLALVRNKIRGWRLHPEYIFGRPDFYFPRQKVAVFVDGCFWHGCPRCGHIPKTRSEFWHAKINRNRQRDRRTKRVLSQSGITVIRVWEHQLKSPHGVRQAVSLVGSTLQKVNRRPPG